MLSLVKPLVVFDLETTNNDPATSRIVEISLLKIHPDGRRDQIKTRRLNPTVPIHPEASAVHGIIDADVRGLPTFKQFAKALFDLFAGCDLCTFNGDRFDIPLLAEEFGRVGFIWPEREAVSVDVSKLYRKLQPRTLTAAVDKYLGRDHTNAHTAEADVVATIDVLECLVMEIQDMQADTADTSVEGLSDFGNDGVKQPPRVDPSGKLAENESGDIVWNFGKYKGQRVVGTDSGFLGWFLKNDFPESTKNIVRTLVG